MNVTPAWRKWGRAALDLVCPRRCPCCRSPYVTRKGAPGEFCRRCRQSIQRIRPPFCSTCCEPFTGAITSAFECPKCVGVQYAFEFAVSPVLCRGPVREVIHRFKYSSEIIHRTPLARLMRSAFHDPRLKGVPWLLVPVPLHPRKEREREFNQSAELARRLSALTGLPFAAALKRTRYTVPQAGLDRENRLRNLKGAFALRRNVEGRDILLIDDVFTTGSTAGECARVLTREGKARRVAVLTATRA